MEESLNTLFAEVDARINSRPLVVKASMMETVKLHSLLTISSL